MCSFMSYFGPYQLGEMIYASRAPLAQTISTRDEIHCRSSTTVSDWFVSSLRGKPGDLQHQP